MKATAKSLAVTLLGPLVVVAGTLVGVAGIDHSAFLALMGTFPATWQVGTIASVLALGIGPILSAYLLVELAASVVPRWRALRHGGYEGRASLERAAGALMLVIAAIEALGIARSAQAADLLLGSGLVPPLLVFLSLVAGVALLVLVARIIQAHGLGNGMAVVIVSALVVTEIGSLRNQAARVSAGVGPLDVVLAVIAALAFVAVTLLSLGVRVRVRSDATDAPEPVDAAGIGYRDTARRAGQVDAPLPVPASGAVPLWALAILAAPPASLPLFVRNALVSLSWLDATLLVPIEIAFTAALVVVLSMVFNPPARLAAVRGAVARTLGGDGSAPPAEATARRELRDAVVRTLAFAGAITAIRLGAAAYLPLVPAAFPVVLATALGADLAAEWRARRRRGDMVPVWPEHRPHAVAPAAAALAAAGIEVHARGLHHRTMLQALGPWAPIELLVPRADAEQARKLLADVLGCAGLTAREKTETESIETSAQYTRRAKSRVRKEGRGRP